VAIVSGLAERRDETARQGYFIQDRAPIQSGQFGVLDNLQGRLIRINTFYSDPVGRVQRIALLFRRNLIAGVHDPGARDGRLEYPSVGG